ncbi:MAG: glycoside hydrolase family 3 N-terminal domain-containing protein [Caldilineaceae bacterium]
MNSTHAGTSTGTSNPPGEPVSAQSALVRTQDGFVFRDLNKNGRLDIYEDPRRPVDARIEDLLEQMTLEEKAGMLFINGAIVNPDGSIEPAPDAPPHPRSAMSQMVEQRMTHFNLWEIPQAQTVAAWHNRLQRFAEETRLGIPITIASDPRNHFSHNIFAMRASGFSQWCETLGMAAIGDAALVREFADIVRREYLAVGIRVALHPQVDLATEPRWARISGTFGEDAHVTARLVEAYIEGFQGAAVGSHSVACMTKHFPGGGPQKDGLDPHFEFQQGQIYPGNNFAYHLIPFEAAIAAKTAAMMPYYGIPVDQTDENVAMSFNKAIITTLLRQKYGYDGVVCTDWGLITDAQMGGVIWPARAWGVEHLSRAERVRKALDAGVDQFGGESCADLVVELVHTGRLDKARLDESVRRLLRLKFQLGLFDNPFVDEAQVEQVLGTPSAVAAGADSQRRAMTLLKNEDQVLPLQGRPKVFVKNIDPAVAGGYADVVAAPQDAEFAIIRLQTPWIPVETQNPFARGFHHGDLDFKGEAKAEILALLQIVPTVVVIYLDRPAVIPEISAEARALLADYGASDAAVLDVIFGKAKPAGKLPFELPSSMEAVRSQKADLPYDSEHPLYPFGFGLSY